MNATKPPHKENLEGWLKEYPNQRGFINNPLHVWFFLTNPPPQLKEDREWETLMHAIALAGQDFEPSTGNESSPNSTDTPLEPPF